MRKNNARICVFLKRLQTVCYPFRFRAQKKSIQLGHSLFAAFSLPHCLQRSHFSATPSSIFSSELKKKARPQNSVKLFSPSSTEKTFSVQQIHQPNQKRIIQHCAGPQIRSHYFSSRKMSDQAHPRIQKYKKGATGGTFDRLHDGHLQLLKKCVETVSSELIVGVTDPCMLKNKKYSELIQPFEVRSDAVTKYVQSLNPQIHCRIARLVDKAGPTTDEEDVQVLIATPETQATLGEINKVRGEKGFPPLDLVVAELIENRQGLNPNDPKLSSTSLREIEWKKLHEKKD